MTAMEDTPKSPKRRRILSSFNTEPEAAKGDSQPRSPSPPRGSETFLKPEPVVDEPPAEDASRRHKSSKFRFKSHHGSSHSHSHRHHHRSSRGLWSADENSTKSPRRRTRRRKGRTRSPSPAQDKDDAPDPFAAPPLDPEAAFRESLFDAMADDEGAAYWEGVYGQPIHSWAADRERTGPMGELERMTDDEYAAYVRQKMWEKTHPGIMEERERRAREAQERERKEDENRRIQKEMERSLRRGEERRRMKVARDQWADYETAWKSWSGGLDGIPWPIPRDSGRAEIDSEAVRAFFVNGLDLQARGEKGFAAKLKEERVRWHPDKMQQKLGGQVESAVMRDVTAIFQTIDKLWNDTRAPA